MNPPNLTDAEHFAILVIHAGNELAELLFAYNASVVRDNIDDSDSDDMPFLPQDHRPQTVCAVVAILQLRRRWPFVPTLCATVSVSNCDASASFLENLYDLSFGIAYVVNSAGNTEGRFAPPLDVRSCLRAPLFHRHF